MKKVFPNKTVFDALLPQLEALARDWADRECTSFDDAVRRAAGDTTGEGSIWEMPAIDSKRTASLLNELEPLLDCRLPSSLLKRGGYQSIDELVEHLLPRIRKLCPDAANSELATALAQSAGSSPPSMQVIP